MGGPRPSVTNNFNETQAVSILRQLNKGSGLSARLDHMCGRHFRALATFMGLQVQGWSGPALKPRVLQYWTSRDDLHILKEVDFPQWFSRKARNNVENDRLGVQARWPKQRNFLESITSSQACTIVTELGNSHTWEQWQQDGNLCINSMFDWLWKASQSMDTMRLVLERKWMLSLTCIRTISRIAMGSLIEVGQESCITH